MSGDDMKYTAVDLFCGCGGLSAGLAKGGLQVVAGFDGWGIALKTYQLNHAHQAHLLDLSDARAAADAIRAYGPDIVAGGPPCQDFSTAGRRHEGVQADLTVTFADTVVEVRPLAFIMENVDRAARSAAQAEAIRRFRQAGYGITQIVLDASLFGVPQKRKRLFTVGVLGADDGFLEAPLQQRASTTRMSVREYFGEALDFEHYYRHPRSYSRRAIFSVDDPSPTVRGTSRPMPSTYRRHPRDAACPSSGVTVLGHAERARIQTFPPDYQWPSGAPKVALDQMLGNAVPVELAATVGAALREFLDAWVVSLDRAPARQAIYQLVVATIEISEAQAIALWKVAGLEVPDMARRNSVSRRRARHEEGLTNGIRQARHRRGQASDDQRHH
ncbi:DNA (cytosine-5-)-methyltransferase [Aliihoeflea sp. 40Bstr573]|nr:DNA (cytosine-5-)-methyltransferase [Aliihoeflea sp. 40Bstr573]